MDDRKSTHRPRRLPAAVALAALGTPLIAASPALADGHGGPHVDNSGSAAEATSASSATAGANGGATGGANAGGNEQASTGASGNEADNSHASPGAGGTVVAHGNS